MNITITKKDQPASIVSEMILGQNIEMCLTTANGLLSDRLRNPKFVGPPHRMTGVAPHWQGTSCGRASYELTPGAGLMGSEAQLIRADADYSGYSLHQNRLSVRAGENLELEIWARAWHEPVTLRVALQPLASATESYDTGEIQIDTSYYKRYTLPLTAGADDNEARLHIQVRNGGSLWIDQIHLRPKDEPLLCEEIIREMAEMRIPTLRYPGGIVVNAWNFRHSTGPVHLRPAMLEAAFHQDWYLHYDFGLDEFLQMCLEQNIAPTLTLNVATGTPDEAAQWADYCTAWFEKAGVQPPCIYWHIANHPYLYTTAHMTPQMYSEVLQTFAAQIQNHYPNNRMVAIMNSDDLATPVSESPWKQSLLENADRIDSVQVQIYGRCSRNSSPDEQVKTVNEKLESFEKNMRTFIEQSRTHNAGWTVGLAEWNWLMQASHWDGRAFEEPPLVLHGLFIAGMIHRFAAMAPDFEVAHFYNLVNCMGILNHRNADIEITDPVEIFKLYRPALPGRFVPLEVTADRFGSKPDINALCLETRDSRQLFLINMSLTQSAQVSLDNLDMADPKARGLCGESPMGTFSRNPDIRLSSQSIELPPLSIVRVSAGK